MYTRCSDENQPRPPENYSGTFIEPPYDQSEERNCNENPSRPPETPICPPPRPPEPCEKNGIFGGLLSRLGNFGSDDLLLFGLIFILLTNQSNATENGGNSDDLLLILALLLIMGS